MYELFNARVLWDKSSCSLKVYRKIPNVGTIQVMVFKCDAQCASLIGRAIDAANKSHEPDCFMLAFGMSDASAFDADTWTKLPHSRELK